MVECTCGWLDLMSNDSTVPVKFSETSKEYLFEYSTRKNVNSSLRIDYCPSCGGKAPKAKANLIPEKELAKLQKLTKDIATIKDAKRILGEPDEDRTCTARTLEWHFHSKTVIIDALELDKGKFSINFRNK